MNTKRQEAFGLVEVIVALGVVAVFIAIFVASTQNVTALRTARNRGVALNLVREELEAIRATPYADLTDRTNVSFMNVAYNRGSWAVTTDGSAPSQPNAYRVEAISGATGLSGVAVLPIGKRADATLESSVKVLTGAPGSWQAGVLFRVHDQQNYYWARFRSTDITLGKVVAGTSSTLFTKLQSFSTNVWYTLKIVTSGATINLYLNGTLLTSPAVSDSSFSSGWSTLAVWDGTPANFDDVKLTTSGTTTWNFDAASETVGASALGWKRSAPSDLPAATEKLTVADAISGQTGLKKVTARLEWKEGTVTKTVELTTYVGQGGISP